MTTPTDAELDYCVCGGTTDKPNPDCERCQLVARNTLLTEILRLLLKQAEATSSCDCSQTWVCPMCRARAALNAGKGTMPRPSTGHPPAKHRCNICGGVVHYDGTPPVPGNWGGKK